MIYHILSLVLLSVIANLASANAGQVSTIELSSLASSKMALLIDQRFEPIYESQPYQATCNREVFDHTETSCTTVSDTVCHGSDAEVCTTESDQVCNSHGCTTIPRRVCHTGTRTCEIVPRRECHDRSIYRTEYFSCTQYHNVVVGQRLVKTFQHQVEVVIDHPELLKSQKLLVAVGANEASISAKLMNSFSLNLLTVEILKISDADQGSQELLSSRVLIHVGADLSHLSKILSSSVQSLSLSSSGISLELPGLAELSKELSVNISLSQHRAIIRDKLLFDGAISSASLSLVGSGDQLHIMIPLAKMGIDRLANKRHNLNVSVMLKRPSLEVLNSAELAVILGTKLEAKIEDARI